uniref:Uncharacterized protein n=1 Tax=Amphimedon queenslandica TaxID=400682 RepID=A0A1X7U8E3_AMPQE
MFQEEELELEHNPDDDCYSRLGGSNLDEGHATTPKRPKTSRKRTRSQESEASAPMNIDATHITRRKNPQISMTASTSKSTTIVVSTEQVDEGDDVYFRFAGATLASMLHNRYKEIRKCIKEKINIISEEIKVLQTINTKDKSDMPGYLKYRDKGQMYSPDPVFIPFFRSVDKCIKGVVNEKGIEDHGNELIKVAHLLASETTHLKSTFIQLLEKKMVLEKDIEKQAAVNVYQEMLRKLCNTWIQEFISSLQQKIASEKGHGTVAGQNLRDKLLSQHIDTQSRVQM